MQAAKHFIQTCKLLALVALFSSCSLFELEPDNARCERYCAIVAQCLKMDKTNQACLYDCAIKTKEAISCVLNHNQRCEWLTSCDPSDGDTNSQNLTTCYSYCTKRAACSSDSTKSSDNFDESACREECSNADQSNDWQNLEPYFTCLSESECVGFLSCTMSVWVDGDADAGNDGEASESCSYQCCKDEDCPTSQTCRLGVCGYFSDGDFSATDGDYDKLSRCEAICTRLGECNPLSVSASDVELCKDSCYSADSSNNWESITGLDCNPLAGCTTFLTCMEAAQ